MKNNIIVVDTVGFGDPNNAKLSPLEHFQQALALVNNNVSLVVLTIREGRVDEATRQFFQLVQKSDFRHQMMHKMVLVCNKCKKGWISQNRQRNIFLNDVLRKIGNRYFEFDLSMNVPESCSSDQDRRNYYLALNERSRKRAVHELIEYLKRIGIA